MGEGIQLEIFQRKSGCHTCHIQVKNIRHSQAQCCLKYSSLPLKVSSLHQKHQALAQILPLWEILYMPGQPQYAPLCEDNIILITDTIQRFHILLILGYVTQVLRMLDSDAFHKGLTSLLHKSLNILWTQNHLPWWLLERRGQLGSPSSQNQIYLNMFACHQENWDFLCLLVYLPGQGFSSSVLSFYYFKKYTFFLNRTIA